MDFFPLLPNTTGHLLCFLKFRLLIHIWIPCFPRRRKRGWHLYRSTREVKCGDLVREGSPKNLSETETCRFLPSPRCVIDINPKLQTMRAKASNSSTYVCKKSQMSIWYLMYSSKYPTQHYIPTWAQWM